MPSLAHELETQADPILNELVARAKDELKGTLYEEMLRQRVLRARYANVLEVLIQYLQDGDEALFRQHHILIFMARYYLDIDAENPLTPRLINWRAQEIHRSVSLYLAVIKEHTTHQHHLTLESVFTRVGVLVQQMRTYLLEHADTLATRIPRVRLRGIEYAPGSTFDIDPEHWP
jgi:hypothetical protein